MQFTAFCAEQSAIIRLFYWLLSFSIRRTYFLEFSSDLFFSYTNKDIFLLISFKQGCTEKSLTNQEAILHKKKNLSDLGKWILAPTPPELSNTQFV